MTERATRFMRENTFNQNLVVSGNVGKDGRIRYRMEDGTVFLMNKKDVECLNRFCFKPRFALADTGPSGSASGGVR